MSTRIDRQDLLIILLVVAIASLIGYLFLDYALDDAFITYRYTYNLSHGQGFVYNPGEKVLATTAPFYALLLASLSLFFENLPRLSNLLGTLGLLITALASYFLGRNHSQPFLGILASLLIILNPIIVLSLGMETNLQMALIALAFLFYDARRPLLWGLAAGLATLLRADGLLVMIVLFGHHFWSSRRNWGELPWPSIVPYFAVVIPFIAYLTMEFGSPLPNSLSAKLAQAYLGFPDYLGWALVWGRDFLVPGWPFLLMAGMAIIGVSAVIKQEGWLIPIMVWSLLHSLAYYLLGVAGYHWYYAPVALAASWLVALGARNFYLWGKSRIDRPKSAIAIAAIPLGIIFYGELNSLRQVIENLPRPRERLYQEVGVFLAENTPPQARVAVMEVGIIGFYSQRPMIDFLGLLQKDVARALARGDIFWTIPHYLPEFLVLSSQNPLYSYYLEPQGWLSRAYRPYSSFANLEFSGSPITIYQRRHEIRPPEIERAELGFQLGEGIQLLSYDLDRVSVHPGQLLELTLYWQRTRPVADNLKIFTHLIDNQFRIYGGYDLETNPPAWQIGEGVSTYHFILVEDATPPGEYYMEVGIYNPETLKRFPVFDNSGQATGAEIVVLSPIQVLLPN